LKKPSKEKLGESLMSETSYTLHYLPEEDRLVLILISDMKQLPSLLLTRRLTRLLCEQIKIFIEKNVNCSYQQESLFKNEIYKFEHEAAVGSSSVKFQQKPQKITLNPNNLSIVTRISIQPAVQALKFTFSRRNTVLMNLELGWQQVHCFFYALSEISKQAGWDMEGVFDWGSEENPVFMLDNRATGLLS
jgi:hypothetical protein